MKPVLAESQSSRQRLTRWAPWLSMAAMAMLAILGLYLEARPWWCACGEPYPISLDAFGSHNSQHVVDPYSLTHVLKGLIYCGLIFWAWPRLHWTWGIAIAFGVEAAWELLENSPPIIDRYRTRTIAQGYQGDTVINAFADIISCALGFLLARRVGWRWSVGIFLTTELLLLLWMKDNLTLSTAMLIVPSESVMRWQSGD